MGWIEVLIIVGTLLWAGDELAFDLQYKKAYRCGDIVVTYWVRGEDPYCSNPIPEDPEDDD